MVVTCVHVHVNPAHIQDFIEATQINHKHSVQETENLRFDVLQDPENPTHFLLYEVFQSQAGVTAHKKTEHYLSWRETVAPWMIKPRQGIPYNVIAL